MPFIDAASDEVLDSLADHCLAARAIIGERGSPVMRRLIDLLLFEVGVEIAGQLDGKPEAADRDGKA